MYEMTKRQQREQAFFSKLKPGKYSTQDLMKLSGYSDTGIKLIMTRKNVITEKVQTCNNLMQTIYLWKVKK